MIGYNTKKINSQNISGVHGFLHLTVVQQSDLDGVLCTVGKKCFKTDKL